MSWYLAVLKNYVGFSGRARRTEFWMFTLFNFIVTMVLGFVEQLAGTGGFVGLAYALAVLLPSLAVSMRRLHDTGRSGWWLLLGLIPLLGAIVLLVFMVQDSKPEANEYGANPKGEPVRQTMAA